MPEAQEQLPQAASGSYRKLTITTSILVYLLVLVGGIVRMSESGLGCGPPGSGLHGWPFCGGRLVPMVDTHMIIEYSHRTLASAIGILLIVLTVWARRSFRENKAITRLSLAALAIVIFEGLLGGLTVEYNLMEELVAIHLGASMLLLGALLALTRATRPTPIEGPEPARWLRKLAIVTSITVLLTIMAGGYVAGTENQGAFATAHQAGAHYACGRQFPTCNDSFLPFGSTRLLNIQLIHRTFTFITIALVLWLAIALLRAVRDRRLRIFAWAAIAVLATQVLLGALNVWLDVWAGAGRNLVVAHLTVGTTLWIVIVWLTLSLLQMPRVVVIPELDAAAND